MSNKVTIHKTSAVGMTELFANQHIQLSGRQAGKSLIMKQAAHQKLDAIQIQIKAMDPVKHTDVLLALLGGLKGAASFNPMGVVPAIGAIEIVMEDFVSEG